MLKTNKLRFFKILEKASKPLKTLKMEVASMLKSLINQRGENS